MKKNILFIVSAALLFVACRKEADYVPYVGESSKLAYSNYTEQFQYLWKCLSTSYVFWDVDTVDWDATYDRLLPQFEALDAKYADSGYVRTAELQALYTSMLGSMRDHHMTVYVKNLHPEVTEIFPYVQVWPGNAEVESRDYYIESRGDAQKALKAFLGNIGNHYTIAVHDSASASIPELGGAVVYYHYCLIILSDGRKVPYLWQSMAAITPVMRDMVGSPAQQLIDKWLRAITDTPRNQLAGIILDNRVNRGGYQDDLDYLVGPFLNERVNVFQTRYKEGPGRLEHSAWAPYYIEPNQQYHRDITGEGIPYVVLCDILSVSMGEIEPTVIQSVFPTSHIIGERTFGGTGPLQPNAVDLNYGAPFGDIDIYDHYVYTSTFESRIGGRVCEGEGLIPDEQVLRKDHGGSYKPQLDAALQYIQSH